MEILYWRIVSAALLKYSKFSLQAIDRGVLAFIGPFGCIRLINYFSWLVELLSTGSILHYSLVILGSGFAFIGVAASWHLT